MLNNLLGSIIPLIVREVVAEKVRDPQIDLHAQRPAIAAAQVAVEVVDRLQALPEVQHATNTEPWYQSRVTIGALVSGFAGAAGLFGLVVSPADVELIIGVVLALSTVIGSLTTLYGRWIARKPIGA